jgi:hypothetical protein
MCLVRLVIGRLSLPMIPVAPKIVTDVEQRIHVLRDDSGDQVEDQVELWSGAGFGPADQQSCTKSLIRSAPRKPPDSS